MIMYPLDTDSFSIAFLGTYILCQIAWYVEDEVGPHTVNGTNKLCAP